MILLFEVLLKLDESEKAKLRQHLESSNGQVTQEKRLLLSMMEDKASPLDRLQLWSKLYPQAPYNELRLNNLFSRSLKKVYACLKTEWYSEETQLSAELDLIKQLQERNLPKHAKRLLNRVEGDLAKTARQSYQTAHLQYHLAATKDRAALRISRKHSPHLQATSDALDQYYLINKLRLACDMRSRSKVVTDQHYDFEKIEKIVASFDSEQDSPLATSLVLQLYRRLYHFLSQELSSDTDYFGILNFIRQHDQLVSLEERKDIYNYLLNYLIRRINRGELEAYPTILELYQLLLQNKVLLTEDQYLSQFTYANICTTGLRSKAYDWTDKFLHDYRDYLYEKDRDNAFTYNLANLYFEQGKLDDSLGLLLRVEFTDAFYHLSAKLLQLKVYYQLGHFNSLYSVAESSRLYLIRNRQLADYQRRSIKNFLRFVPKLARLTARSEQYKGVSPEQVEKLHKTIADTKELAQRGWLIHMLERVEVS